MRLWNVTNSIQMAHRVVNAFRFTNGHDVTHKSGLLAPKDLKSKSKQV